jgi:hypothetical protein
MSTSSLEKKIVAALVGEASSADLSALVEETERAIVTAEHDAKAAAETAMDPAKSPDLKAARALLEDSQLAFGRLQTLKPRLELRLRDAQAAEFATRWNKSFEQIEPRHAAAVKRFERYPALVAELGSIFTEAAAVDAEASDINGAAPSGEHRRLVPVECAARGLQSFSRDEPSVTKSTQLADWEHSKKLAYPPSAPSTAAMIMPVASDGSMENWHQMLAARDAERRKRYEEAAAISEDQRLQREADENERVRARVAEDAAKRAERGYV